jgi:AraC family transcriptional regulator
MSPIRNEGGAGMTFPVHIHRYEGSSQLHAPLEWPNMRIEHRLLKPGFLRPVTCTCTTISVALGGRALARWMDGAFRPVAVRPGIATLQPVGLEETEVEITAPVESLLIFLAPWLTASSALGDYDIDPARVELVRTAGMSDPLVNEVATALRDMSARPAESTDSLFAEGASSLLAAHLVSRYSNIRLRSAALLPSLSDQKLKRVIDLVESRFAGTISLDELAAETCLSPFHFARLFRKATGLPPHRYITERRIQDAKARLAEGRLSLLEVALEAGFGSQGNFNRIFRKHTGLTPGQFRRLRRNFPKSHA